MRIAKLRSSARGLAALDMSLGKHPVMASIYSNVFGTGFTITKAIEQPRMLQFAVCIIARKIDLLS